VHELEHMSESEERWCKGGTEGGRKGMGRKESRGRGGQGLEASIGLSLML